MKEGEVLLLLSKTNGDWWQVDPLLRIASILFDVTNILVVLPCSTDPQYASHVSLCHDVNY